MLGSLYWWVGGGGIGLAGLGGGAWGGVERGAGAYAKSITAEAFLPLVAEAVSFR